MPDDGSKSGVRWAWFRTLGKRLGQVVTILALGFLAWELHRQWGKVNDWRPTAEQAALLLLFALLYGMALFSLAWNWLTILSTLVNERLPARSVLLSYTQTQIAKFLPGNVFHFVSRHMFLKVLGLSHRTIAFGTVIELASLPIAALSAVCLLLPFTDLSGLGGWSQSSTLLLLFSAGIVLASGTMVFVWRGHGHLVRPAVFVLLRATGFMLFLGLIFAAVLHIISGEFVFLAMPIAILAWLIGFATPGAPGGVAVREALLVKMLAVAALQEDVLIAALLFRGITTVGDLVLFALGRAFVLK